MSEISYQFVSFANLLRRKRQLELMSSGKRFPIFRSLKYSFDGKRDQLLDRVALLSGMAATRIDDSELLLDDGETLIHVNMYATRRCIDCNFLIWTSGHTALQSAEERLLSACGVEPRNNASIQIDWHFHTSRGMGSVELEEIVEDVIVDQAYPSIGGGVLDLAERFLSATENVLVLQGPPGTGKTRLIREILAAISRRKGDAARVLYTGDQILLETDELFVKFVTGSHDAFVFEDGDHFLQPRVDGNPHLHRLLTVSDGLIQSTGRKIIFSTNLPNIGDLDDALLRPGRCFAHLKLSNMTMSQAHQLLEKIENDPEVRSRTLQIAGSIESKSVSLASIYKHLATARMEILLAGDVRNMAGMQEAEIKSLELI